MHSLKNVVNFKEGEREARSERGGSGPAKNKKVQKTYNLTQQVFIFGLGNKRVKREGEIVFSWHALPLYLNVEYN